MTSRVAPSPLELFAAAVALLLPIAYASGIEAETWSGRAAILLVVIGVGLPLLVAQARGPRPLAARSALAFILIGCASAALSHNHTTAVFGLWDQGTGLLFMASLAAAWAIGRAIRPEARSLVERALIVGVLINVAVAILSMVVDLPPSLALNVVEEGRASGLAGNAVFLAALAVLGLALVVPRFAAAPLPWSVAVVAIAAAAQLSGTRLALVVMLGVVVWAGRRIGLRTAVTIGLLLVLGLAIGTAIGPSGTSATARTTGSESGDLATRPQVWWSARHSIAQHPLLGVGPGQFSTATSRYRSASVARVDGPDSLFTDAHNILVEYATTTGLLGLAALVVWLVAAVRQGWGWLLVGALGVLAIHFFEPQSVVATPLLFLALGASAADGTVLPVPKQRVVQWVFRGSCVVVSLVLAAALLIGEFELKQGQLDLRLSPAEQANGILPAWPRTASLLAQVWLFKGIVGRNDTADYRQSRTWRLVALHRDGADPSLWDDLAELDASNKAYNEASDEFMSALRLNPTSARSMIGLSNLAAAKCDAAQEAYWYHRAIEVSPPGYIFPNPSGQKAKCGG